MSGEPDRLGLSEDEADREIGRLLSDARRDVPDGRLAEVAQRLGIAPVPPGGGSPSGADGGTSSAGSASGASGAAGSAGSSSIAPPAAGALGSGLAAKAGVVAVLVAVTGAVVFFATRDEPTPPTEQARESTERAREATEAPRADPSAAAHAPLPDPRAVVDDVSVPVEPQVPARVTRERGALPRRAGGAAADVERESARGAAPAEPAEATLPLASAVREEAEATRAEPRATVAEPAPDTTPETSEASLLARARRALARDPGAALAAAEEHARRFPDGILAQEREVVRIESLARLGRSDVARRRLADLERRWPSSPHRARLRDLLAR